VQVSPVARELATAVLRPPLAPLAGWLPGGETVRTMLERVPDALYGWTLWPAIGLLPASVRESYGLPWGAREQLVSDWLVAGWRAWRLRLPVSFRQMPQALAADRRMAGARYGRPRPRQ
jgi:uncharacterized protein (DUF2236 family)